MPTAPIPTGAKAAQQLVSQLQKQIKPNGPTGHSFGQVLQNKIAAQPPQAIQPASKIDLQKVQKTPTAIQSLFNTWSKDSNSMQKIMDVAMSGQNFNPNQLLVLQQATYKVTFELETMGKLVEQASSAVKTTMQTQV